MLATHRALLSILLVTALGTPPAAALAPRIVLDSAAEEIELVSVRADGKPTMKRPSTAGDASHDGRYVTFGSRSRKLVAETTCRPHLRWHIYVRDRNASVTTQVDVRPDGLCAKRRADANYSPPRISGDGRLVVFGSFADGLADGSSEDHGDIFVRDLVAGTTTTVSVAHDGGPANGYSYEGEISADGTAVVFFSTATNLVDDDPCLYQVFRRDLATSTTTQVSKAAEGGCPDGVSESPSLSGDGELVLFSTEADDVVGGGFQGGENVVLYDLATDSTILVSRALPGERSDGSSRPSGISADGSTVAFESDATNLINGDTNFYPDVFAFDVATGVVTLVSRSYTGEQSNAYSFAFDSGGPDADGSHIPFSSNAYDIVPGDDNGASDAFVADAMTGLTTLISVGSSGGVANDFSRLMSSSGDGSLAVFYSAATDIVSGTPAGPLRVYAHQLS